MNFRAFTFAPGCFIFLALRFLCLRLLIFSTVKIQFFLCAANGDCLFTGLRLIPGLQKLLHIEPRELGLVRKFLADRGFTLLLPRWNILRGLLGCCRNAIPRISGSRLFLGCGNAVPRVMGCCCRCRCRAPLLSLLLGSFRLFMSLSILTRASLRCGNNFGGGVARVGLRKMRLNRLRLHRGTRSYFSGPWLLVGPSLRLMCLGALLGGLALVLLRR